LTSQDTQG